MYALTGGDDWVIDKWSAPISKLFNKQWLSHYPRAKYVVYDNGSKFKLHFAELCDNLRLKHKSTSVKNPQANAILERLHADIGDMLRTSEMDMSETVCQEMIDDFLTNAAWVVHSTYHTVLKATPGAAIFGQDMMFNLPTLINWKDLSICKKKLVDASNLRENTHRVDYDYQVDDHIYIKKDGIFCKLDSPKLGPFRITDIYTNVTVRIQRSSVN